MDHPDRTHEKVRPPQAASLSMGTVGDFGFFHDLHDIDAELL